MKTKHIIVIAFLSAVIGAVLGPIFYGWTYTYDNDTPAVGSAPGLGYAYIQEIKKAAQERMNVDHYWPLTGTQVSDSEAGQHRQVEFYGPITTPTHATNKGWLYIKDDVDDKAELHWLDEDGNEKQITSAGILKVVAGDYDADSIDQDDIRLANDSYLTARNVAGDGDLNIIKANASGVPEILVGAVLSADTEPASNAGIANKKYVDDQITAIQDPTYSGGESHTFDGGLIIKRGSVSVATSNTTKTFAAAFPASCLGVWLQSYTAPNTNAEACIVSRSTTNFVAKGININPIYCYWIALGY